MPKRPENSLPLYKALFRKPISIRDVKKKKKKKTLDSIKIATWIRTYLKLELTAHKWQKWKRVFLTCPSHEIYKDEAVGLKSCKYTWKITIYVNMCNLGQFREILIFCQYLLNWSSNLKILLHMCDTYNCDYLKHMQHISSQLNRFSVRYRFPFPILRFLP